VTALLKLKMLWLEKRLEKMPLLNLPLLNTPPLNTRLLNSPSSQIRA